MEQYISKSALIKEIERLKECNRKICGGNFDFLKKSYPEHYYSTEIYDNILSFLDTLEVKEVDSELNSFEATVCKIGSTYLKEMDRDAIVKALESYKDGDKVKVIIKAKGE